MTVPYMPQVHQPRISGYGWFARISSRLMSFATDKEALEALENTESLYTKYGLTPEDDYLLER